jgi:transposase-like protein
MIKAPSAAPAVARGGKSRIRRQRTAEEKARHLALFAGSGLTQTAFCEQMGVSAATFSQWRRQARAMGVGSAASAPAFAEVLVTGPASGAATPIAALPVTVHVSGGTRIEVPVGTDPLWLASLLRALSGA